MAGAQVEMVDAQWFCHVTTWQSVVPIMKDGLKPSICHSYTYDGFLRNDQTLPGVWFVVRNDLPTASCYPFKDDDAEEVNPMIHIPADAVLSRFHFESDEHIFYEVKITAKIKILAIIPAGVYTGAAGVKMNKWQNNYLRLASEADSVKFLIPEDSRIWISLFIYVPEMSTLDFTEIERPQWSRVNHIKMNNSEDSCVKMVEAQWFCHFTTWQSVVSIMKDGLKPSICHSPIYDGFLRNDQTLPGVWFVVRNDLQTASCYPFKDDAEEVIPMIHIPADAVLKRFHFESDEHIFYEVNISAKIKILAVIPAGVYTGAAGVEINKWQNNYLRLASEADSVKFLIPEDSRIWISLFIYVPPEMSTLDFAAIEGPQWSRIGHIKKKNSEDSDVLSLSLKLKELGTQ